LKNDCSQKTIAKPCSMRGIGIHTGSETEVSFKPAGADEGIRFVRTDLPGKPEILATVDNVDLDQVVRQTVIRNGETQIRTVEHVLAALTGLGIDNVVIELDSCELPVGDGSALPYVDVLAEVGTVSLDTPRQYIEVKEPICMVEDSVEMVAIPASRLEVTFKIDYDHPAVGIRSASFAIDPETFRKEIAPARTFCFLKDVEDLRKKGLLRGGSLENAIVIGDEEILNEDLRYPDEIVRHKVLDTLGDLALLGKPLKAHVIGVRSGHFYNVKFVDKILEKTGHRPSADHSLPMGVEAIRNSLPHRYPFLMVDRIVELDQKKLRGVGLKNVSVNEPFFQGHWPNRPVMPGVLLIESMAQVGGVLLDSFPQFRGRLAYLLSIDKVKLRRPVVPGDQLRIETQFEKIRGRTGKARSEVFVDGKLVAEAEMVYRLVEN